MMLKPPLWKMLVLTASLLLKFSDAQLDCPTQMVMKNGCFQRSALVGTIVLNYRDASSSVLINWDDYQRSINRLACDCAKIAKERGFNLIAIQFFGECYGSARTVQDIAMNLIPASTCIGGDFKPCDNKNGANACSGTADSFYLYALGADRQGGVGLVVVNGGYSEWGPWSDCSATCGGGVQARVRLCNSPTPANGGANCTQIGPPRMTRVCGVIPCPQTSLETKYCTRVREDAEFTYVEAGLHFSLKHPYCIVVADEEGNPNKYRVSAQVYGYNSALGVFTNTMGLIFNVKDLDNYQFVYLHLQSDFFCFTHGRVKNGEDDWLNKKSYQCPSRQFYGQQWIELEVYVNETRAEFRANSERITYIPLTEPNTGRGGVLVKNGRVNSIFFMRLRVD